MSPADIAALLIGIIAIGLALVDVFQSVIVPRAATVTYRISLIVWRSLWTLWPPIAWRIHPRDATAREELLATFAPFALIVMLLVWVVVLVLGYGMVFWALRSQLAPAPRSYWDAAYFAGTSLLTIGFGDIVARNGFARLVSICAGASGLGVFSITTAYLFAIFGTFQRREAFIVSFAARAGSPPSGVGLFEIAANSSHDEQSWVGTLGALLDASLIANTALESEGCGEARICFAIGRHAVHDLGDYFGLPEASGSEPGIDREEFDRACRRLAAAGYALRDRDAAWRDFARARGEYAERLNAMARFFHIPPVQWIGERASPIHH